jgi:hypothetical protein
MLGSPKITTVMLYMDDTLAVVRSQSEALIRAEVRGEEARKLLERACYEAVTKLGCTAAEVAIASGLPEREIQRIVRRRTGSWESVESVGC